MMMSPSLWRWTKIRRQASYTQHPQLRRFRNLKKPIAAIATYLKFVQEEAQARGYKFDESKIAKNRIRGKITVTHTQIKYEMTHLLNKLKTGDKNLYNELLSVKMIKTHPLFQKIKGPVEDWEVIRRKKANNRVKRE